MIKTNILIAVTILLVLSLQGCVSSMVKDAIDAADEHTRLKWSEEWKPALMEEIKSTGTEAKDAALREAIEKIENYEQLNDEKLRQIGVELDTFDQNQDGRISGQESVQLLQEIKAKNDAAGNPLSWWEIFMIVAGAYVPLTGGKELLRSKISKKPDPNA